MQLPWPVPEGIRIGLRLSHQDLASIIGSTRETVTVILGELQADDSLSVARRQVVLTDVRRLAASVDSMLPNKVGSLLQPAVGGANGAKLEQNRRIERQL